MKEKNVIMISSIFLTIIGLVMIYSASNVWSLYKLGNKYYYMYRQLFFIVVGIGVMFLFKKLNLDILKKYAIHIWLFCLTLLIMVLIPNIGMVRGGARSWIGFGIFSIQPAEFMKLGMVIILGKYLSIYHEEIKKFKGLLFPFFLIIISFFLIMLEPDFGTGMVLVLGCLIMILICGIKTRWIIILASLGLTALVILIASAPYRLDRISAYLDPWSDPLGSGFQTIQSLYAISPSGLFGRGLFQSRQKYYYLPEPQTDFIMAIIIEEVGLIGCVGIFILFFIIFYNGILIALKTKDEFKMFLAYGITIMLFIQFSINIGVVIGLLPVTGITLPFLSYGGSSLVLVLGMMGILTNIGGDIDESNN